MTRPHITILMATCNGARYLSAQLDSLLAQTHGNWSLVVSDDGSQDDTLAILRAFDLAHPGRLRRLTQGPAKGSAAQNFMQLLMQFDGPDGLVALADQDDVWLPRKLARAADHFAQIPQNLPAIYASESLATDAKLRPTRQQSKSAPQPDFRNALVQNLFAGHSTVLNRAALALVQKAGVPRTIAFHDWWLYQLVACAGGRCILDPARTVLYRQHGDNAFGAATDLFGMTKRIRYLLCDDYAGWLRGHWQALAGAAPLLTPAARDVVRDLLDRPIAESRAAQFRRLSLRRGSRGGTAVLWLAARLGRI